MAVLATGAVAAFHRIVILPDAAWRELANADRALRSNTARALTWVIIAPLLLTLGMFLGTAGVPLFNAPVLSTNLSAESASAASLGGLFLLLLGAGCVLAGLGASFTAAVLGMRVARLDGRSFARPEACGKAAPA
ncbi:hypothetical protein [Arthrobacter sp. NPDC057009]|uniref:hypothetical protein n=1 Tax=Arthrobacter sp. NPDC057009 TaxID=3345996 RepID=UPI0036451A10